MLFLKKSKNPLISILEMTYKREIFCFRCKERREVFFEESQINETTDKKKKFLNAVCPKEGCGRKITTLLPKNLTPIEQP